jgi:pyruvate dehydrogenase E2 component (dihydrolipoamide acetyltransferase)
MEASGGKVAGAAEQPVPPPMPTGGAVKPAGGSTPDVPASAGKMPANGASPPQGDRVFASPLARRMAQQAGLDLNGVQGSGPQGRIVKSDIEAALNKPKVSAAPPAAAPAAPQPAAAAPTPAAPKPAALPVNQPFKAVPNSGMRKVIARRLSESKATIPHFYVAMDIELDALLDLRAKLNAQSPKDGPGAFKLSVNDLVIKASPWHFAATPASTRAGPTTPSSSSTTWTSPSPSPFRRADHPHRQGRRPQGPVGH